MDANASSALPFNGTTLRAPFESTTALYTTLLLLPPLIYFITKQLLNDRAHTQAFEERLTECCNEAWLTPNWDAFYGLLYQCFRVQSSHHPFVPSYWNTVQKRWNDGDRKPAMKALLERGIIPLVIHDGGLNTETVREFSWMKKYPWIRLPVYRQAKSRAYFEFAVPVYDDQAKQQFIQLLENNNRGFAVSIRYKPRTSTARPDIVQAEANPPRVEDWQPLIMGAESVIEALLPFMPDKLIKRGGQVAWLDHYVQQNDCRYMTRVDQKTPLQHKLPCLFYSNVALVRIESQHWGHVKLERLVLKYAQSAKLEREFKWRTIREPLLNVLERCDVTIDEFRQ
ncbi:hypothetical protein T440DRAFT_191416 [Plenodomus tracheiphilus IPT5]|uniref:Uncharacterized protein n=1 Tax=Plenodomus tracheiphilus IPT5 TaxID=1408161 RepID=A0A6A7AWG7_9PLEO|nr:hypothetical protein T440DRAFT_191416 [Plenodomus tracheiphilus IPT5]